MKKILVIEDELAYMRLLRDQLVRNNFEVLEAKNGREGLVLAERDKPDLILLDIRMPVLDGMTMLGELRKSEFGKRVKVIILTNIEPDDKAIKKVMIDLPTYYPIKSDTKLDELIKTINEVLAID